MNVAFGSDAGFITRKLVVSWVNRFDLLHVCAAISKVILSRGNFFSSYSSDISQFFSATGERSSGARQRGI